MKPSELRTSKLLVLPIVAACVFASCRAYAADTGVIRGKVRITETLTDDQARALPAFGEGGGVPFVAVYVSGIPGASAGVADTPPEIELKYLRGRMTPPAIVTGAAYRLIVSSDEDIVFTLGTSSRQEKEGLFLVQTGQRASFDIRERNRGVACIESVVTQQSSSVLSLENSIWTMTDANGNYELREVPAGNHNVRFWHPMMGLQKKHDPKAVREVREDTETVLDVTLELPKISLPK